MKISAKVANRRGEHSTRVQIGENERTVAIAPKQEGLGSSVNGGELLFLALATCFCNDIYREAAKRGMEIRGVQVEVTGELGGEGEPAREYRYCASVDASASREAVLDLMRHTDSVAEIHNTIRRGSAVIFSDCEVREL